MKKKSFPNKKKLPPFDLATESLFVEAQKKSLAHFLHQPQNITHSLLTGAYGCGLLELSLFLSRFLLCPKKTTAPCNVCPSCQQFFQNNQVDFHKIAPDEQGFIRPLALDFLKQHSFFAPIGTSVKILFIDQADRLTPQSAACLLKILESSPSQWIFF